MNMKFKYCGIECELPKHYQLTIKEEKEINNLSPLMESFIKGLGFFIYYPVTAIKFLLKKFKNV